MNAVTRPGQQLDLTIMREDESQDIKKTIAAEGASDALALIDETTQLFGLKGNEYPGGRAVVIQVDTKPLDENESLDRFLLTRVQIPTNLLHSILNHKNLTYIGLTEGALYGNERVTQFCTGLENNEKITTLNLLNNHFSTAQLDSIIKVIGTMKVERFFIAGNDCNSSSMKLLADSLPTNTHLKEISLCPRHVDANYAANIQQIIRENKSLTNIKLYPVARGAEPSYLLTRNDLNGILEALKTNHSLQEVLVMNSLVEPDVQGEFAAEWSNQMSDLCAANASCSDNEGVK